jgi:hypothetical protein
LIPCDEYSFMMCQSIGRVPISTMGLGRVVDSSAILVPLPPARITHFKWANSTSPDTLQFAPAKIPTCCLLQRGLDTNPQSRPAKL